MALGDVLGGFVRQRNIDRELAIGEGQLAVNEQILGLRQKQADSDALDAQRENIINTLNANLKQIGDLKATGTEEGLRAADLQMRRSLDAFAVTIQMLEGTGDRQDALLANLIRSGLENIAAANPTPQEQAVVKGEASTLELGAQLGREATSEETATKAGVGPSASVNATLVAADGTKLPVRLRDAGGRQQIALEGGVFRDLDPSERIEPPITRAIQASDPNAFDLPPSDETELRLQSASANSFGREAFELVTLLRQTPDAATMTAGLVRFATNVQADFKALSRTFSFDIGEGLDAETLRFSDELDAAGLADANQQVRSAFTMLALLAANSLGLGQGRALSNDDFKRALTIVGADNRDPALIANQLERTFNTIRARVADRATALRIELPEVDNPFAAERQTIDDLRAQFGDDNVAINPATGQVLIFDGTNWVEPQ